MKRIFIGLLFVFFDFNISINEVHILGLLPDFIGYFLVWKGCGELAELSENFANAQKPCAFLMILSAMEFCSNLLGGRGITVSYSSVNELLSSPIGISSTFLVVIYTLVTMGISIYVLYSVTYGMVDVEMQAVSGAMRTSRLISAWKTMVVCDVMSLVSLLLLPLLAILLIIAGFVAGICYLVFFHTAWKTYELTEPHE